VASQRAAVSDNRAVPRDEIAIAMRRLRAAERERREAIEALVSLGVVRSKRLVAGLGEEIAARYYGVALASNANEPGYDLVSPDGRLVQVRALRSEPHRERTLMGVMTAPPRRQVFHR
jgi:hypothetical protein